MNPLDCAPAPEGSSPGVWVVSAAESDETVSPPVATCPPETLTVQFTASRLPTTCVVVAISAESAVKFIVHPSVNTMDSPAMGCMNCIELLPVMPCLILSIGRETVVTFT
jgi:hypothetical protein